MNKSNRLILLILIIFISAFYAEQPPFRNVIYYGDWTVYNKFYPSNMEAKSITHINFAFMDMDENGDLKLVDEYADFQIENIPELKGITFGTPYTGVIGALSVLKLNNPHLKIGISVAGWTKSGDFPGVAKDKVKRKNFANNIAKFIDYLGFDFVDIDWEHPTVSREGGGIDEGCLVVLKTLRILLF